MRALRGQVKHPARASLAALRRVGLPAGRSENTFADEIMSRLVSARARPDGLCRAYAGPAVASGRASPTGWTHTSFGFGPTGGGGGATGLVAYLTYIGSDGRSTGGGLVWGAGLIVGSIPTVSALRSLTPTVRWHRFPVSES